MQVMLAVQAPDNAENGNSRTACTNCRQSHVACSHELPCARCVRNGIEDSCHYLPRKRRTDFKKKRRQEPEAKKQKAATEENPFIPPDTTFLSNSINGSSGEALFPFASPQETESLLNATLSQLFGEEYPFPLLNTNQSQVTTELFSPSTDTIDLNIKQVHDEEEEEDRKVQEGPNEWICKLSKAINNSDGGLGWALPFDQQSLPQESAEEDPTIQFLDNDLLSDSSQTCTSAQRTPLVQHQPVNAAGTKTLRLLQEMKQKNERLEQLLRMSLHDIKTLKEREQMYQQQTQHYMRESQRSFQLFTLGPARDFDQLGLPGIAMFSLLPSQHGRIIQCNQTFQLLVGRTWQELNQGISCCQLFPKRILPLLCQKFSDMTSPNGPSSAEGELVIARPSGEEIAIKAYSHVIFGENGEPLYKVFYAFSLH